MKKHIPTSPSGNDDSDDSATQATSTSRGGSKAVASDESDDLAAARAQGRRLFSLFRDDFTHNRIGRGRIFDSNAGLSIGSASPAVLVGTALALFEKLFELADAMPHAEPDDGSPCAAVSDPPYGIDFGAWDGTSEPVDVPDDSEQEWDALQRLRWWLFKQKLPFTPHELELLAAQFTTEQRLSTFSITDFLAAVERCVPLGELPPALGEAIRGFEKAYRLIGGAEWRRLADRMARLLKKHGYRDDPPPRSSRALGLLLNRETLQLEMPQSLTEQLLKAMVHPDEDDPSGTIAFAPDSLPEHARSLDALNRILADPLPLFSISIHDERRALAPVDSALRQEPMFPAVAAAALAAMTHHPIRHARGSPQGVRFFHGVSVLIRLAMASFEESGSMDAEAIAACCDAWSRVKPVRPFPDHYCGRVPGALLARIEILLRAPTDDQLVRVLRFRERVGRSEIRDAMVLLDEALGIGIGVPAELGERWSDRMYADLCAASQRDAWRVLINLCAKARGSAPSPKWLKNVDAAVAAIGRDEVEDRIATWLGLVGKPRARMPGGAVEGRDSSVPSDRGSDLLRGMAWAASRLDSPRMARVLGDLAMVSYKMLPGIGARCSKAGTGAVWGLAQMSIPDALAQLSRVRQLVKFKAAKNILDSAFDKLSQRLNLSPDELHELAAPDFGLEADGTMREQAGDFVLELQIEGSSAVVRVLDATGTPRKSVPAAIKRDHIAALKSLKQTADDVSKMLPAQKDRLERLYQDQRQWPLEVWRTRYLDHPLVGTLSRRLIWTFSRAGQARQGIWSAGGFIGADGTALGIAGDEQVALWHPIHSVAETVQAWRILLEQRKLRQPFKQAHREIYVLTEAERETHTYSNRFATHIIRQNQLAALCQQRGWKHHLFMLLDIAPSPTLHMARHGLFAQFDMQPIGDEIYGMAGGCAFLQTDRVYFSRQPEGEPLELASIDPLVFSEVMRDVDLFVGICSIGNSPEWDAQAADGDAPLRHLIDRFQTYWWNYSFGILTESGLSRRTVLESLLPRLSIGRVCELDSRFLKVRGKLRTYKIHLGSGNILMEPNDQYLCIVPARGMEIQQERFFLPFEGDRVLAIILSKAFMLAEDDKIKDSSIVSQIKGR